MNYKAAETFTYQVGLLFLPLLPAQPALQFDCCQIQDGKPWQVATRRRRRNRGTRRRHNIWMEHVKQGNNSTFQFNSTLDSGGGGGAGAIEMNEGRFQQEISFEHFNLLKSTTQFECKFFCRLFHR